MSENISTVPWNARDREFDDLPLIDLVDQDGVQVIDEDGIVISCGGEHGVADGFTPNLQGFLETLKHDIINVKNLQ